jgi:hypothetical protein
MRLSFLKYLIIPVLVYFIIGTNFENKFYGFEYEDAFINAHIATSKNYLEFVENFRTLGCNQTENGNCIQTSSYTGHYAPYSFYLFSINKISHLEAFKIHKLGNAILLICFIFILFFSLRHKIAPSLILILTFISCLPTIYVLNSALIENISFFLGSTLILIIYLIKIQNQYRLKFIAYFLLILIVLVKRENLIYLGTLMFFVNTRDLYKKSFYSFIFLLIISQLIVNPFYTEGLEAAHLNLPTFSWKYFQYQFPVYIKSFFRIDGFLLFTVGLLAFRPSVKAMIFILGWLTFIILYGLHYRGQFSIEQGAISHFESFRYMYNTLPFLLGYFLFSKEHKSKILRSVLYITLITASILNIYNSKKIFNGFIADEQLNYHSINEKINSLNYNDLIIYDNFVLISMLNSLNEVNQIKSYIKCEEINLFENKPTIIIDRFNVVEMEKLECAERFILIDSLSSEQTSVYGLFSQASKEIDQR